MNKFKTLMAAMLITTSVTACSKVEPEGNNVTVVEDADTNVPSSTAEMNNEDNVEQNK